MRDWLCLRDIAETSLNRLLLLLILKSSHRGCSLEKITVKNFDVAGWRLEGKSFPTQVFSTEIQEFFKNTYFQKHLYLYVTLFTMHEKDTANEA